MCVLVFLTMIIVNPGSKKIHTYLVTKDTYAHTYLSKPGFPIYRIFIIGIHV